MTQAVDIMIYWLLLVLTGQNYVGSVVKQCLDDGQEDDDEDDDGSDGVFGITTVINITKRKVSWLLNILTFWRTKSL